MKFGFATSLGTLGLFMLALASANTSRAQCGGAHLTPSSGSGLHLQAAAPQIPSLGALQNLIEHEEDALSIVGFWHVKFISKGNPQFADGTEIDAGYAQWHLDGTEIMNSAGRSTEMGNFCLGVWKSIGPRQFQLNHFAAAYDATGLNLIGPANIRETVTVAPKSKHFSGTFTIEQYDEAGNLQVHFQGIITGDRIDVDTPPTSIF